MPLTPRFRSTVGRALASAGCLALLLWLPVRPLSARTPPAPPQQESQHPEDGVGGKDGQERPETDAPDSAPVGPAIVREGGSGAGRELVGKIRGTVLDQARKPVTGLLVQLASRDEKGLLRVTGTDARGHYLFRDLRAGVYDLQLTADGYGKVTKESIEVRPPFQNIVDFHLTRAEGSSRGREGDVTGEGLGEASAGAPDTGPVADGSVPAVMVRGRLVDHEKQPVVEASVILIGLRGGETYHAFSGEDGRFVMPEVIPGRYRALVASPGHVTLDLKSVLVSAVNGLDLSLSLVDYPLNFRGRQNDLLPREEPHRGAGDTEPSPPESTS